MKSKKLFAILTLVAFMMAMVPMAAFGANTVTTPFSATAVTAGASTAMAGTLVITGTAAADFPLAGTIVVTAPTNVSFDTTVTPDAVIGGAGTLALSAPVVTASTITYTVTTAASVANTVTIGGVTPPKVISNRAGSYKLSVTAPGLTATDASAAITVGAAAADMDASSATVDYTSVTANGTSVITMTVYVFDQYNNPVSGVAVAADSSRGADTVIATFPTVASGGTPGTTDATGKAQFTFKSYVAGAAKIGAGLPAGVANLVKYLQGATGVSKTDATLIDAFDVTFAAAAPAANGLTLAVTSTGAKANGIDTETLTATLKDSAGNPVANATVNFSVDNAGAVLSATSATTNAVGMATTKISSSTTSAVNVTANVGSVYSNVVAVPFVASGAYTIELVEGAGRTVATGTSVLPFKFKVSDINGNMMSNPVDGAILTATSAVFTSKPTGTTLANTSLTATNDSAATGYATVTMANPDKAGTYTIRLALANGKSASVELKVADQGVITGAIAIVFEKSLAHSASAVIYPYLVDAANVSVFENAANFNWSASDTSLATVAANGIVTATGTATKKGTVIVTGIHKTRKYVVTASFDIGTIVSGIKATTAKVMTDEAATVNVQLIDDAGNNRGFNAATAAAVSNIGLSATVISKPEGANVTVSTTNVDAYQKGLSRNGATTITVKSDKAGIVKLAITADKDNTLTTDALYTAIVDVEFGAAKVVVGAKNVTMFIGALGYTQDGVAKLTDVAPFLKDSRTFVAVRPVADAFGAEIGWNEATQTVTLTRADVTVTIVIGSNAITVVKDGVTSTVTADVPASITNGRTVLPFRAVGDAFGATSNWDAATQSVTYIQ